MYPDSQTVGHESEEAHGHKRRDTTEDFQRRRCEFHERLKAATVSHGAAEVATLTGTNYETARRYLTDATMPPPPFLTALCVGLGISAEWLLCGRGEMYWAGGPNPEHATVHDRIEAARDAVLVLEKRLETLAQEADRAAA